MISNWPGRPDRKKQHNNPIKEGEKYVRFIIFIQISGLYIYT